MSAAVPASRGRAHWLLFGAYLAAISAVASRHEMWRDEVRAWSIAVYGTSPLDMIGPLSREGHPFVWYALLRGAHALVGSPVVLPLLALLVAAASAALFVWCAPFSLRWKALFLAGVLPLYEYSVMSRNYGIGMLGLFGVAILYRRRFERPLIYGCVLFLLANTSAHAAVAATALLTVWVGEVVLRKDPQVRGHRGAVLLGTAIATIGIVFCLWLTYPPASTQVSLVRNGTFGRIVRSLAPVVLSPGDALHQLIMPGLPLRRADPVGGLLIRFAARLTTIFIVVFCARLWRHRDLLGVWVLAVIGFGLLFHVVYPSSLRHVGLLFIMLIVLEWLAREREAEGQGTTGGQPTPLEVRWWSVALVALLSIHAASGVFRAAEDFARPVSSSRAFGEFMRSRPDLAPAIVVAEPYFLFDAFPYYVANRIYAVREGRFAKWTSYDRTEAESLSLGTLLSCARALAQSEHVPVVLVLAPRVLADSAGLLRAGYGRTFTWEAADRRRLAVETREIARFTGAVAAGREENFVVLLLVPLASALAQ